MSALPREAHEGLMRAWLKVLHDRQVTWVPVSHQPVTTGDTATTLAHRDELASPPKPHHNRATAEPISSLCGRPVFYWS
jgi:hypothetical protein